MKITKNNYELFFLSYYESDLQAFEIAELMLFLEQHPDLKAEFENFEIVKLDNDSSIFFSEKESLKKTHTEKIISENDFIDFFEGEMSSEQKEIFISQVENNTSLKKDLELFEKTRLTPDTDIVFDAKNSLKKSEIKSFTYYYKTIAVAASLLLLIGLGIAFLIPKKKSEMAIVTTFPIKIKNTGSSEILKNNFGKKPEPKKELIAKNNFHKRKTVQIFQPKPIKQKQIIDTTALSNVAKTKLDSNLTSVTIKQIPKNKFSDSLKKATAFSNKTIAIKKENQDSNLVSLKQMVVAGIKSKLFGDTAVNENKFSIKNLVRLGFRGVQKATNNKVRLKEKINNKGDITAYTVTAGIFGFSHTFKK